MQLVEILDDAAALGEFGQRERCQDVLMARVGLGNVDVFGQAAVGSYYILWDNLDLSVEMKNILTSRNFAKDEFFMQNIDREQFEQERVLQLFEDKKREYFKLFPDDEDQD